MANGQDLISAASGAWNPWYLGYAIDTGAANPKAAFNRDRGNHLFSEWMMERWRELIAEFGWKSDRNFSARETISFASIHPLGNPTVCDIIAKRLGGKLDAYITASHS